MREKSDVINQVIDKAFYYPINSSNYLCESDENFV